MTDKEHPLEGRTKPVVDPLDNVWHRNRSTDPWRSLVEGETVYKTNEEMNPYCRGLTDEAPPLGIPFGGLEK